LGNVVENEICNQLLVLIERTFTRRGYLSSKTLSLNELFGVENQKEHKKKIINHQNIESVHLISIKVIRMLKIKNINYLWRITYGYQGLWGVTLGSIMLG